MPLKNDDFVLKSGHLFCNSRYYHNYGYGNSRDYGLADKKTVLEQLSEIIALYIHAGD